MAPGGDEAPISGSATPTVPSRAHQALPRPGLQLCGPFAAFEENRRLWRVHAGAAFAHKSRPKLLGQLAKGLACSAESSFCFRVSHPTLLRGSDHAACRVTPPRFSVPAETRGLAGCRLSAS